MRPKPDPIGPLVLETVTLTLLAAWRWRLELALAAILTAVYVLAGENHALGLALIATLVALVGFVPYTRRFLTRLLRAQHVKRQWTQAVIDSGAADPPPKRSRRKQSLVGARAVKVTPVKIGDQLEVKGHIRALMDGQDRLAENLDTRWSPVNEVRVFPNEDGHANCATVLIVRRDPFKNTPPLEWKLIDAERTSTWDPLPFGMYEDGEDVLIEDMDGHVLISGVTGSGKSVAMHTLIARDALDPSARVVLLDNKQAEFSPWQTVADAFVGPSMRDAVRTLQGVQNVMVTRFAEQTAGRLRKVGPGDETYSVFIDELAYYLLHPDKEQTALFWGLLLDLLQRGRSAGIRIRAATQRPSAEIINTNLRAQFGIRICFRVMEPETVQMVLGYRAPAHQIPREQRGVGFMGGESMHPRRFRAPFLSEQDVDAIVVRAERIRTDRDLASLLPQTAQAPRAKAADLRAASVKDALLSVLPTVGDGMTRGELREATGRPDQETWPAMKALIAEDVVVRDGGGKKGDPFRYRAVRAVVAQNARTTQDPPGTGLDSA